MFVVERLIPGPTRNFFKAWFIRFQLVNAQKTSQSALRA